MADPGLAAALHDRLMEIEAGLLLEQSRLERAGDDAAQRADAERRAAKWRARRDEVHGLLEELRRG